MKAGFAVGIATAVATTIAGVFGMSTIGGIVIAGTARPAAAEPVTPVIYTSGSSATRTTGGLGFDTCTAPSVAALRAWKGTSAYRTVNVYVGGVNRACTQPLLTATWVREVAALGWKLLPTYMGRQPVCMFGNKPFRYNASNATSYGNSDARDAVVKAKALGIFRGSALYADVEHYDRRNASCVTAVRRYVSAWTKTAHESSYLAGVYVHRDSGLRDLSASYGSTAYARPDAIWIARWDCDPALRDWPNTPNTSWSFHQRAKQYRGDHTETWGGVALAIDSDSLNAPVATVARSFTVTATLNARTGPTTAYPVVRTCGGERCRGHVPGPRPTRRDQRGLGPSHGRHVGERPLRVDAIEHRILGRAARVHVPGSGHDLVTRCPKRAGHVLFDGGRPTALRGADLRHVPKLRHSSRHVHRVEPPRGRPLGQRLPRREPLGYDVEHAGSPLPVTACRHWA